ncbi:phospholipase D3 [Drosophila novamexicana]|uniref:phospholipase D3 n=1 Tax=Drosophila novamexicana TaxID=47314 RepID=UPI0011E59A49|nr:phospholipase D3 [Drosophila novamexicana]
MSDRRKRGCMPEVTVDYHAVPLHGTPTENLNRNSNSTPTTTSCCRRPAAAAAEQNSLCCGHGYIIPVFILFVLVLIVLLLPWETLNGHMDETTPVEKPLPCQLQLVETIPIGLNYTHDSPKFLNTYEAWQLLLTKAKATIDIAAPYWTLRGVDVNDSSTQLGEQLFQRLLSNGDPGKPKLRIRIALNKSLESSWHADARIFANYGAAQVVAVKLANEGGALHTKLWIVDGQHFYLGSANMDWRSLTQVKELGVLAQNCPQLARDLSKIFKAYWQLGSDKDAVMPKPWPWSYYTPYNLRQPMLIRVNRNYTMRAYISSAPPPLTASGRTHDLDAILNCIDTALEFVHIAVMDYYPLILLGGKLQFWPPIDNALRKAAVERGVAVKLLISWWKHSDPNEDNYLRSLQELSTLNHQVDIQIRRFIVPSDEQQLKIPFARVNHNAYMVTERVAYIGTSNWSGEYFTHTAGVGLVLAEVDFENETQHTLRSDLLDVFARDWHSPYALPLKYNLRL